MRYNDWDVLLFPAGQASRYTKTPFKEFGVICQVIPDVEQAHCQGSVGLPIVTCFVPSIQPGAPFQVSVHSWTEPEITQFTKSYSKHVDAVQFEARLFIDGQLVSSTVFNRKNREWPHIIETSHALSKSGELARLEFPAFKKELLAQKLWSPGDDTGRIKVVISEGFPRDSLTMPLERVKNVVAFSFQHAPLDVLEANRIAWPNPSMWRVVPANFSQPTASFHTDEDIQSHAHSPRHQSMAHKSQMLGAFNPFGTSSICSGRRPQMQPNPYGLPSTSGFPPGPPNLPSSTAGGFGMASDSLNDVSYYNDLIMSAPFSTDFTGKGMWSAPGLGGPGMSGHFSSMMQPDYMVREDTSAPFEGEPMHLSGPSLEDDEPMAPANEHTKVPTNTPTAGSTMFPHGSTASAPFSSFATPDFAHSLTHSLLNQPLPQNIPLPASEIKSRKERDTRFLTIHGSNPTSNMSTPHGPASHPDIRKFSQPLFNPGSGVFGSTTASTSPASATLTSATVSRNVSTTDSVSNVATVGSVGTPGPLSTISGGSCASLDASSRKRNRNFTPLSSKAIDDEDQPLRPSPHTRTGYMVDDESDQ